MKPAAKIAFPIPTNNLYSYKIPAKFKNLVSVGKRAYVSLGKKKSIGYIISIEDPPEDIELKEIIDIIDDKPLFDEKRLGFFKWISNYYFSPLGLILKAAHPGGLGINLNKKIQITDSGNIYLQTRAKNETEIKVLKALASANDLTLIKLFEIVEGLDNTTINKLSSKKYIEIDYEIGHSTKIKTEKYFNPGNKGNDIDIIEILRKKRPAKARILDYISGNKGVSHSDLKQIFGSISSHIRWLDDNGYIDIEEREILRDPFSAIKFNREDPPRLNPDQQIVMEKLTKAIDSKRFKPFLLHGVTGSGKTEIYMNSIDKVTKNGGNAIVLVPEISLTPQLVSRFRGRFGNKAVVLHSGLSDGERFDAWRQIRDGSVNIAIGARSSIFAPFSDIDIIIVDEEHETSYKQEESPYYNARDLSLVLGKMYNAVVILGSATPSAESYYNSLKEKLTYLSLPLRVSNQRLPDVEIIDMTNGNKAIISEKLKSAIIENFKINNQTIIFLNKRGFSSVLICKACGESVMCPNCSITLTFHLTDESVRCHYCGLHENKLTDCLKCGHTLSQLGHGTQRVEEEVKRIIPGARIARMDSDTMKGKHKLLELYEKLEKREIDLLIGTQMVAKGHDLPGVTLVGVISADLSLYTPDFRSGERTFQLITQVAGRAGRGSETGRVLVQAYNHDHPAIIYASGQDSIGFLNNEIKIREELSFPPFSRLINIKFTGKNQNETAYAAKLSRHLSSQIVKRIPLGAVNILGPSAAPVSKIKNKYRWQMLLKATDNKTLHSFASNLLKLYNRDKISNRVNIALDVDPVSFN